ncbi:ComEC/Rec2 family competence protein [Clostridium cadaveris]|uniref:ComEC/Rec2 family competence protein n=1 Tax=Clostridium cadaveris TaxID=1529 RepID=UPI000C0846F7|nr:ComEC/Rec2 family competence protein [Clostridium cadaveris]
MQNKILKKIILVLVVILSLSFAACSSESSSKKAPISTGNELKVHFIDVGQGDSILVQFKDKNLLIDAGPRSSSNDLLKYLKGINLTKLDYVVATHPHEDHIGGMPEIIKNFEIGEFYAPKKQVSTKIFQTMVEDLKKKNHKINVAKAGVSLDMDSDISVEMIAPNSSDYENVNNYSAVIKVTYKDTSFLFTGDAEKLSEKEILQKKYDIKADVLKLGHHGSSTSSSKEFLDKVNPKIAVASLGKNNDYGHPHKEIIKAMKDRKISFYRTDELGTIVLKSDGKNITKE